jgi:hypothetical protein
MKGYVSFHPVDLALFDGLIAPLFAGSKVNPEEYLQRATLVRRNGWIARGFAVAIEQWAAAFEPPKADPAASPWKRLRANLERIDHKPDVMATRAAKVLDPELHLDGRPFLIGEGSAERVAAAVDLYLGAQTESAAVKLARDQIARLEPDLAREIEPAEIPEVTSDLTYRNDLLALLRKLHDMARLAREGRDWTDGAEAPRPAAEAIPDELPWRAMSLHARVTPFWLARDVDGLETICRAAGVRAPDCLSPAWRLFAGACEEFPALKEALGLELRRERDVGAFVSPGEVGDLLRFLAESGARIISAAAREGEGPMATALLRKIKECAVYAQRRGFGYVEAAGILPPERE